MKTDVEQMPLQNETITASVVEDLCFHFRKCGSFTFSHTISLLILHFYIGRLAALPKSGELKEKGAY